MTRVVNDHLYEWSDRDDQHPFNWCCAVEMTQWEPTLSALKPYIVSFLILVGAAGNFLCPVTGLSTNAYKTVLDIDTVGTFNVSKIAYQKYLRVRMHVVRLIKLLLHCSWDMIKNTIPCDIPSLASLNVGSRRCYSEHFSNASFERRYITSSRSFGQGCYRFVLRIPYTLHFWINGCSFQLIYIQWFFSSKHDFLCMCFNFYVHFSKGIKLYGRVVIIWLCFSCCRHVNHAHGCWMGRRWSKSSGCSSRTNSRHRGYKTSQ